MRLCRRRPRPPSCPPERDSRRPGRRDPRSSRPCSGRSSGCQGRGADRLRRSPRPPRPWRGRRRRSSLAALAVRPEPRHIRLGRRLRPRGRGRLHRDLRATPADRGVPPRRNRHPARRPHGPGPSRSSRSCPSRRPTPNSPARALPRALAAVSVSCGRLTSIVAAGVWVDAGKSATEISHSIDEAERRVGAVAPFRTVVTVQPRVRDSNPDGSVRQAMSGTVHKGEGTGRPADRSEALIPPRRGSGSRERGRCYAQITNVRIRWPAPRSRTNTDVCPSLERATSRPHSARDSPAAVAGAGWPTVVDESVWL